MSQPDEVTDEVTDRVPGPQSQAGGDPLAPYDAVLLLSFGGPEAPDEVMPFLENVTRGRGIGPDRLGAVAEHYLLFGGRSPINDQNRLLLSQLRSGLGAAGAQVPLYWGNRNWRPYLVDTLRQAHDAGARRLLTVVTSAYPSYSGCRQYREDLASALITLAAEGRALAVDKIRHYVNHPGFLDPVADSVIAALENLPPGSHVAFVTHSIPVVMNSTSGPDGGAYVAAHEEACAAVLAQVAGRFGRTPPWRLVYCSRSGPPSQPWLEPDVNEHLEALSQAGAPGVVVVPVGFVSDHMEVIFDLDTEAEETAGKLGLPFARAATAGTDPRFVDGLVELLLERAARERGGDPDRPAIGAHGPWHDVCPVGCCRNLRVPDQPAACGADWIQP
jgi:ferrochelatase